METSFIDTIPSWARLSELCRLRLQADLVALALQFADWSARAHQRRRLAALDDRLLKDIELNRTDAMAECSKPFWRP